LRSGRHYVACRRSWRLSKREQEREKERWCNSKTRRWTEPPGRGGRGGGDGGGGEPGEQMEKVENAYMEEK